MAAAFGGETWLLAVFGGFPVSYAASSGIIISWAPNIKPQEMQASGTHSSWSVHTAHRWYCGIASVLKPLVDAPAPRWIPGHRRCLDPSSVRRLIVGIPASRRCSSPSWGFWPLVGAPAPRGDCGLASVLQPLVGAPAHSRCAGPSSVPRQKTENRRPAPRQTRPNKAVERTGNKLALVPRRSPPALGCLVNGNT